MGTGMLAPPTEDSRERDVGALHGEKRESYLKSLGMDCKVPAEDEEK